MQQQKTSRTERKRLKRMALKLLESPRFFNEFLSAAKKAGLVGEEINALIVFIVLASRLLPRPLQLLIKGRSSSGKNYLAKTVLRLLPKRAVIEITSVSDKAFYYSNRQMQHAIIFLQERNDAAGNMHPLRLLISEGKVTRWVTVRVGGKWVTKKITVRGPVASLSTTTKPVLQLDDENRHISIRTDESPEQTRRIVKAYARGRSGLTQRDKLTWRMVQRLLEKKIGTEIVFPEWFDEVEDRVQAHDLRMRRYWPAFVEACRTVCMIRSFQERQ